MSTPTTLPWQLASYFAERPPHSSDLNNPAFAKRWQRWSSKPFDDPHLLQQRLEAENSTLTTIQQALAASSDEVIAAQSAPPDWAQELAAAYSEPSATPRFALGDAIRALPYSQAGFLFLVQPLLARAIQRLENGLDQLTLPTSHPFSVDQAVALWFANLPRQLIEVLHRSLVLELNVARLREQLQGDTPEQRFQHFIARLQQGEVQQLLLHEYVVLARIIVTKLTQWTNNGVELIGHLCEDWPALGNTFFSGESPGQLCAIKADLGDSHRQGRCVVQLAFSNAEGNLSHVIYKPRAMAVELQFQRLLAWTNQAGWPLAWRTLRVLDRGRYGWVEFVSHLACDDQGQIERYFERQGAYLALLYMLDANDFHAENVIAHGEHPMLIDLESLFQARQDDDISAEERAQAPHQMSISVLRVGLLPQMLAVGDQLKMVGSGLTDLAGQLSSVPVLRSQHAGTDQMQLTAQHVPVQGSRNLPLLQDQKVSIAAYASQFDRGFVDMYRWLMQHQTELLAADGPLAPFQDAETRIIFRNSSYYQKILHDSYHPDFLRDGLMRDRYLDRLWGGVPRYPRLARVLVHEKTDLLDGDLPLFTTFPGQRDVYSSSGVCIPALLRVPAWQHVREKIGALSEADLALQQWLMHSSLALAMNEPHNRPRQTIALEVDGTQASSANLLTGAEQAATRLLQLAFESASTVSWLSLQMNQDQQWQLAPLDGNFYSGLPGIALFFGYLGQHASSKALRQRYTEVARKTLRTLELELARNMPTAAGICGLGGLIYCYTHLAALWHDDSLLQQAERFAARLTQHKAALHDILYGLAGALLPVLALAQSKQSAETMSLALQLGDTLLANARQMPRGIAWDNGKGSLHEALPQAGFSHGSAGIAYALAQLAQTSGEPRFALAAQQALEYDRSLLHPTHNNWHDLANDDAAAPQQVAWCHGAPGVGLTRLLKQASLADENSDLIEKELQLALRTTEARGFGRGHCLCHGDLGNLELLLAASLASADPALHQRTYAYANAVLKQIEKNGWRCGVLQEQEAPGFMLGLAGIGYGLLRLAFPASVPSALVLAPPMQR